MALTKGDRQAEKESVEDNFDEILKIFEGDTDLHGQICESSDMWICIMAIIFIYLKKHGLYS